MQADETAAVQALQASIEALLAARVLSPEGDWASVIGCAVSVQSAADDVVRAVVLHARRNGATWRDVGDALGITRQAAFQRYGRPIDPRTGEPMSTTPLPGATDLAAAVIDELARGQWALVTERFDPTMRHGLSDEALAAAWAQVVGLSGAYENHGEVVAARAGDVTITNTPLSFEAGDYNARITFRDDHSVAGLLILTPDAP